MFRIIGLVVRILYTVVSDVPKRSISGGAVSGESETHVRALTLAKKGQCDGRRISDNRLVARRDKDGMNCRHLTKAAQRAKNPLLLTVAVLMAMMMMEEQCFCAAERRRGERQSGPKEAAAARKKKRQRPLRIEHKLSVQAGAAVRAHEKPTRRTRRVAVFVRLSVCLHI